MSIYIISLILILISGVLFDDKLQTVVIATFLFLVSALRDVSVGKDLVNYLPRYHIIAETHWRDFNLLYDRWGFESGYLYLNKLLSFISNNERILLVVTSGIIIFSFSYFIYKNSPTPWLSFYLYITLYFFGTSFNTLRINIAMSIALICIEFLKKNKITYFSLGILFASLFHTSALVFLVLYPLSKIKINTRYLTIVAGGMVLLRLLGLKVITIMLTTFGYERYLSQVGQGDGLGMLLLLIMTLFAVLYLRQVEGIPDPNIELWIQMVIISIAFTILSLDLWIVARVMMYFRIVLIIIIPVAISSVKDWELRFISYIMVTLLSLVYFFMVAQADNAGIIPYYFMSF